MRPLWEHKGAARRLVHRLKYQGMTVVAGMIADELAALLPQGAAALVPVPRTWVRRIRYGVDPAAELAVAMGRSTGLPVLGALRAPLWSAPLAAAPRYRRRPASFRPILPVPPGAVIVDDVVTTGRTLSAVASSLAMTGAVALVATASSRIRNTKELPSS